LRAGFIASKYLKPRSEPFRLGGAGLQAPAERAVDQENAVARRNLPA
jgi:hypothetical protein